MIDKLFYIIVVAIVVVTGAGIGYSVWEMNQVRPEPVKAIWPAADENEGLPFTGQSDFEGVDISHYQGNVHWRELRKKNPNLEFVYLRAIGSKTLDTLYQANVDSAHACGIAVGTYHFFTMNRSVDEQYKIFVSRVKRGLQDLRPVIDVEQQSLHDSAAVNLHLKDSVMRFAKLLEAHYRCKPVIYSNQNFYNNLLAPDFNNYPLWIANYTRKPKVHGAKPVLWQRSDEGHVRGIWTYVDLDKFINGGSILDLRL